MKDKINQSKRLYGAIGNIGDDLISEAAPEAAKAESRRPRRKTALRATLIAACVTVFLSSVVAMALILNRGNEKIPDGFIISGSAYTTGGAVELPESLSSIYVTAEGTDSKIIPVSGSFMIETAGECDAETLAKYVTISPTISMAVEKRAPNLFKLTPARGGFTPGTLYRVTLGDSENPVSSYVFQAETQLCIKTALPADKAVAVPVNTGIEFTFSDALPKTGYEKYFSVSPKTSGRFMLYPDGRTVAFIPSRDLKENTVYTVTVSGELKDAAGRKLGEDKVYAFRTASAESSNSSSKINYISLTNQLSLFSTSDSAYLEFYCSKDVTEGSLEMFRFDSFESAAKAIEKHEKNYGDILFSNDPDYETTGLKKVHSTKVLLNSARGSYCFTIGDGFEAGVYLCNVTATVKLESNKLKPEETVENKRQALIIISDLRVNTVSSDGKTIVWVHDVKGNVIGGADVKARLFNKYNNWNAEAPSDVFETVSGTTDGSGIFVIENGSLNSSIITVSKNGSEGLATVSSAVTDTADYYLSYIYTDREVYFSSDSVNFYGWIAPRFGLEMPEKIYLSTGYSSLKTEVKFNPDGSFSGSFPIENFSSGNISLKFTDVNGTLVAYKIIRVTEENKPLYSASISFDKIFYRYGETMSGTLKVTFFDGTPAPGISFRLSSNYFNKENYVEITDKNGEIKFNLYSGSIKAYSSHPVSVVIYAELIGMETQRLLTSANTLYFHSDYYYTASRVNGIPTMTLNKIDTSNVTSLDQIIFAPTPDGIISTPISGKEITYTLYKQERIETTKSYYDMKSKRVITYTEYTTDTSVVKSGTEKFKDGVVTLPTYKVSGFKGSYYYEISYRSEDNIFTTRLSATEYDNIPSENPTGNYTFKMDFNDNYYLPGDTLFLTAKANDDYVKDVLFLVVGDGIQSYGVGDSLSYKVKDTDVPTLKLYCVIYVPQLDKVLSDLRTITYDFVSAASLDISLETDKPVYKPGETATVKISVPGAPGASVLLSIVDEACFALGDQNVSPLSGFYGGYFSRYNSYSYFYGYYYDITGSSYSTSSGAPVKSVLINASFSPFCLNRNSHYYTKGEIDGANAQSPAEADPEGSSPGKTDSSYYIRSYFANNPEFLFAELDPSGCAVVTFKVPDNITTWRLTAIAADGLGKFNTVRTGAGVSQTVCTQEFFINPSICDYYVMGDDISFSARAYGNGGNKVNYVAYLYDDAGNFIRKIETSAKFGDHAWFNFGKQEIGCYSVIVTADSGSVSDAVKTSFSVIASGASAMVDATVTPEELKNINPLAYPITLSFYDNSYSYSFYYNVAGSICGSYYGERSDAIAAYYQLLLSYSAMYGTDYYSAELSELSDRMSDYVKVNGLVSLLTYSDGDIALTARILAVTPKILPENKKVQTAAYCNKLLSRNDITDDVTLCAALLCLASLDEPVLDTLYNVASVAADYSLEAKLYLAAAFAAIGDYSGSNDIYSVIMGKYADKNSEYNTLSVKFGNTKDQQIKMTGLALLTASRINKADAEMLARYLVENREKTDIDSLELASYLRFFMPTEKPTDKKLVYKIGTETTEITLKRGQVHSIILTKSEYSAFEIVSADENVGIKARYRGSYEDAYGEMKNSDRIKVVKNIEPYYSGGTTTGLYKVTINISGTSTRRYESFRIDDCIPSGARFISNYNSYAKSSYCSGYICNASGQKMSGYVSIYYPSNGGNTEVPEYSFSITLSYLIRGAVSGEYVVEETVLCNPTTNTIVMTDKFIVNIDKNGKFDIKH